VFSSKVEVGQGSRAQLGQAAAEELRPLDRVRLFSPRRIGFPMTADFRSRTTGYTVPDVRKAAAAAREVLIDLAARQWGIVDPKPGRPEDRRAETATSSIPRPVEVPSEISRGRTTSKPHSRSRVPADIELTPVQTGVLSRTALKPTSRDVATGAHRYPSDIVRPGMLRERC
jgi:isoquinoline 1-oxidoreductase